MWIWTKLYAILGSYVCIWASMLIYVHACSCELVGACACVLMCVRARAGRPKRHCAAATTEHPAPPTPLHPHPSKLRHNKEQLNTAALPAEEPTTSHTSTNRQICLKPKGRSNKSQPTESNPLQSPSADSNQKVTGWLHPITHYRRSGHITIRCVCKMQWCFYTSAVWPWFKKSMLWEMRRLARNAWKRCEAIVLTLHDKASFSTSSVLSLYQRAVRMWRMSSNAELFLRVCCCMFPSMTGYSSTGCVHGIALCLFDLPKILLRIKAFSSPH